MIDLPQHAAQVALLRDLLLGQSPWGDLFRINLFTPYLLGYALALPLSFVMPVAAALKLLLSVAYVAYVFMCVHLRRQFGADPRLDWLCLLGFFGFAYDLGFFTFLLGVPIALGFILATERYLHHQSIPRMLGLFFLGLVLLASHGLLFLFAWTVGLGMLVLHVRGLWRALRSMLPFAALSLAFGAYILVNRQVNKNMQTSLTTITRWNGGLWRLPRILVYALTGNARGWTLIAWGAVTAALLCVPWLLGLRVTRRPESSWVVLVALVLIFVLAPGNAAGTVFFYPRFALFLLPAYAWLFRHEPIPPESERRFRSVHAAMLVLLVILCWGILGVHTLRSWRFAQESASFDAILEHLEPGQRALALVFDPYSDADGGLWAYLHYPAWYQAEKQGLVDLNFAWAPPQIVRFRPDRLPAVEPGFEWHPERFDWARHHGSDYRYFFVRSTKPLPDALFKGADCPPTLVQSADAWRVFEYRGCP